MNKKFDIIVIGAGAGGLNVASFMNDCGFQVLLVDKDEAHIGGDCLNHGCIPSKSLIHVSKIMHERKNAEQFLERTSARSVVDIVKVMDYIRGRQSIIRDHHENKSYFEKKGITVVLGNAVFTGERTVRVGDTEYTGKKIVIATGSRPRQMDFMGNDKVPVYTSDTIWDIDTLPQNFVFIGAGPISLEIGQSFLRFGSQVTVIDIGARILPREIQMVSDTIYQALVSEGMDFYFDTKVEKWSNQMLHVLVSGRAYQIPCDAVFLGIGRELNIDRLDLEHANIERDTKTGKIILDGHLRTTNKSAYVVGDAVGQHMFTHAAELHARVVIEHFFNPFAKPLSTRSMSWVMYTDPEIATFGLSEEDLKKEGVRYEVLETHFTHDDRAITQDNTQGFARVYVSKGIIQGGTMIADGAGELIQELILAQTAKLPVSILFNKTYPYPTASRINKDLFAPYFKKKLTPLVKRILRLVY